MTAGTHLVFDPKVTGTWELGSGLQGVLLIHGFSSTPRELRYLGEKLAAHNYRCLAPQLIGHGTTPEDLATTRWQDWAASAQHALDQLEDKCKNVMIVGQSMGGTLALHLAAHNPQIKAVATLATPIWVHHPLQYLLPIAKYFIHWQTPSADNDLYDREAIEKLDIYGRRPTSAVHEFMRLMSVTSKELALIRAPVTIFQGRRDRSIDPDNATSIESHLCCSQEVERHMLERSGHGISVDIDKAMVSELIIDWFERHTKERSYQ